MKLSPHSAKSFVLTVLLLVFTLPAMAQNTSGVFGPEVTPGSRAFEFRTVYSPSTRERGDRFASRFHYQQSVSDNLRLRGLIIGSNRQGAGFDFDVVQFEALYQFKEDEINGWDSALRLDFQHGKNRPDLAGLHWTNDFKLNDRWGLRAVLLTAIQTGNQRNKGVFLQTRSSLRYRTDTGHTLQLQMFNTYGSTANFPGFNDQVHTIGPAISGKLTQGWAFEMGALFGFSDRASNVDFRFFLSKSL